jgi:hypothetical protein
VDVISVLLFTIRPPTVSVLKCTVIVLAPANGTMRMVVLRVVLGLNAAVLFVLAATTLVEGPIFHDVEFPPCFTYTPVQLVIVLLGNPVGLMVIVNLHSFWLKLTGRLWLRLFTFVISPESKVMKSLVMSGIDTVLLL